MSLPADSRALTGSASRYGRAAGVAARLAQHDLDALGSFELCAAAGQKVVEIVRLDPVAEELDGNRDLDGLAVEIVELEGVEPARVDVISKARTQRDAHL